MRVNRYYHVRCELKHKCFCALLVPVSEDEVERLSAARLSQAYEDESRGKRNDVRMNSVKRGIVGGKKYRESGRVGPISTPQSEGTSI